MPSFPQLLSDYGYVAVFVGCLLEGETLLILAGFAAQQGLLSLPVVIALAFVGGTLGDQAFFFTGKHFGAPLLVRFPRLGGAAGRVRRLLQRFDAWLIVGVRFMYGLRIAGPIVIGTSGVAPLRFLAFNLLGAAIWAPLIASIGYVFGESLQWLLTDVSNYQGLAMAVILGAALLVGAVHRWRADRD